MDLAREFVAWLVTAEAQRLWQRRLGEEGGPTTFELRRQPIRHDLFLPSETKLWSDPQIAPFTASTPMPAGMPGFYRAIAPMAHAMAIDVHEDLVGAWRAINVTPDSDPRKAQMLALFDAMPPELALVWPSEQAGQQWRPAVRDPNHPMHDEVAGALSQLSRSISAIVKDKDLGLKKRLEWTLFFRDNYRQIMAMAEGSS